ncbi:MAG: NADP(H)-dependent aldo-keto reductase [Proteobacteria bacterium]|nr:NADP(H)-dependent aldo-keto reductase [Pseudomonadota bacterium]
MQLRELGRTGLKVSALCLGTMTWGEQNTEAEAHAQMDYAVENGVNFFDAAEMYPVPPKAETQGRTEAYIGSWFKKSGKRDKIILATKVAGVMNGASVVAHLRDGTGHLNKKNIMAAVEDSLKRLQTDVIDLYQLHAPDRSVNCFGQLGYKHNTDEIPVPLEETLEALQELMKAGKVRFIGVSNETPWGVMRFLELANMKTLPRMASVQNPYNLLNRSYEVGLAEISIREQCGLLAYSPLAFGVLSGKYLNGARPPKGRLTLYARFQRYTGPQAEAATKRYVKIANDAGLDPAQMAIAFVNSRDFVTSNIIGATTLEQLKSNIGSIKINLQPDVMNAIDAVHREISNPCP